MRLWVPSIRTQLLLWLLIPVLTLGSLGSVATYFAALDFANGAYDDALADSARALASRIYYMNDNRVTIDLPEAAKAILDYDNEDRFFYQVLGPRGRLIAGEKLFIQPESSQEKLRFWNASIHGQPVRVATLRASIGIKHPKESVTIHVAETFEGRNRLRFEIFTNVILTQILFIILSAGSIWLGVARGLAPLDKIKGAIMQRSPQDLSPLSDDSVPTEIKPLTHAINDLMGRLEADLMAQRRFISNAAHQLRTPIAGLKTQTDLAIRSEVAEEQQHALQQIQISIERTIHLANQLLSLARTEQGIINFSKFQHIDLGKLVRKITRQFVPQARQKQIDLGYEGTEAPSIILADPVSISEMVSNLVENAVKYCRTGDQVTVSVHVNGDQLELQVVDTGPGIPVEEKERVFERFYRVLGNDVDGSGLGLSIVREIAHAHKAEVQIKDGPGGTGTSVLVVFPFHT